jgi:hypothetical protein
VKRLLQLRAKQQWPLNWRRNLMKFLIASLAALAVATPAVAQDTTTSTTTTTTTPATKTTHHVVKHHKPVRHHHKKVVRHKHVTHVKAKVSTSTTSQ